MTSLLRDPHLTVSPRRYERRDLAGEKFGLLTAKCRARTTDNRAGWLCLCECGHTKLVQTYRLKEGLTRSCGCLKVAAALRAGKANIRHGLTDTRTFRIWSGMLGRCNTPSSGSYKNYGARGIKVCARWETSFQAFLDDMGTAPDGMQLDRINNNGNYEKANCRWASRSTNMRNRRNNRLIEFNGKTQCLQAWADEAGLPISKLKDRLDGLNWPMARALTGGSP